MPLVLYVLALAVFAQGTSEFMLSGIGPDIAREMNVPLSSVGLLTSAFAVGMIVGAPSMAVLARRWPARRALLGFLAAFLLAHVVGALTTSFPVLLGTRVLGALGNAGFLAVALATATSLVPPERTGRATSVLLSGVTLACVAGVPAGTVLGQSWGWRAAFWAVSLVSLPALYAVFTSVPGPARSGKGATLAPGTPAPDKAVRHPDAPHPDAPHPDVRREARVLRTPRLLRTLLLAALVNGGTFCAFTYLAPVVTEAAGFARGWVPVLLALFGLGSFVGVTVAGRLADTRPLPVLAGGGAALFAGWALFALTAGSQGATVVFVLVQGALSFGVGSTLIARVLYEAAEAPTLAGGFATAALNVGAAVGPWAGGLALGAGLGPRAPLWVSALLVGLAAVVAAGAAGVRALGLTPSRAPGWRP